MSGSTIIANGCQSEDFQRFSERHATTASGALNDKLSVKAKWTRDTPSSLHIAPPETSTGAETPCDQKKQRPEIV